MRTDGILSSRPVFSGTCPTHPSEGPFPAVPHHPRPSSAVFRCFPLFSTVPYRPLPSPTRIYLRSWGLSSFLMTAILGNSRTRTDGILSSRPVIFSSCCLTSRNERRGWTMFCRPFSSRALGSPPAGRALRGPRRAANTVCTQGYGLET